MSSILALAVGLLVALSGCNANILAADSIDKPTTNFTTEGRVLLLSSNDRPTNVVFPMRGFSYSSYRIGEGPNGATDGPNGFDSVSRPSICEQDFGLMRKYNVNTIKIYDFNTVGTGIDERHQQCLDIAWNNGTNPIFVILSVYITTLPFPTPQQRTDMATRYQQMVSTTADHPAVLGYSVGSEIGGDPNNNPPYWADFNAIAKTVRKSLNGRRKIITTGTYQADCTSCSPVVPCIGHIINGEKYHADVDVWGVDVYSPNPQDPLLLQNIWRATTKPFYFPEYGVTYQPPNSLSVQSELLFLQTKGIGEFSFTDSNRHLNQGNQTGTYDPQGPVYVGGLIFEWDDEYWKGGPLCSPNAASAQPYYGANSVSLRQNCTCPGTFEGSCGTDIRIPRPILANASLLPSLWIQYRPGQFSNQKH